MAESVDQPERLMEILREMITLSKGINPSASARNNCEGESLDAERVDGIDEAGASRRNETGDQRYRAHDRSGAEEDR